MSVVHLIEKAAFVLSSEIAIPGRVDRGLQASCVANFGSFKGGSYDLNFN